jgi:hypothetical protein
VSANCWPTQRRGQGRELNIEPRDQTSFKTTPDCTNTKEDFRTLEMLDDLSTCTPVAPMFIRTALAHGHKASKLGLLPPEIRLQIFGIVCDEPAEIHIFERYENGGVRGSLCHSGLSQEERWKSSCGCFANSSPKVRSRGLPNIFLQMLTARTDTSHLTVVRVSALVNNLRSLRCHILWRGFSRSTKESRIECLVRQSGRQISYCSQLVACKLRSLKQRRRR